MLQLRISKMWRPSATKLVVLLLGISCFIYNEAARSGPGTGLFSGSGDVSGISEMIMVRPSLQRKILEEGQSATTRSIESKADGQEKKWEPKTEDKPKEGDNKQWQPQPQAAEDKKDWSDEKLKEDVEKKWDSQPKEEEQKKEWKLQENVEKKWNSQPMTEEEKEKKTAEEAVQKKWDSQPKAEDEKKEWKPKEDGEKNWDSQSKAGEEKEWVQEQPNKEELAVNPQESKSGNKEPIKVEETWQNQEPRKLESQQQVEVEERKEETWTNQEPKQPESEQQQVKVEEEKKEEETWQNQNQEPRKYESEQQQIKVEEKKEEKTWQNQNQESTQSESEQQQIKAEKKEDTWQKQDPKKSDSEQQPWKPAEEWKAETKQAEKVEEPKIVDAKKSENQWQSNNTSEEKPKEVTKVEEKKEEPAKVEDWKEEPKKVDDVKLTTPKVEEKEEEIDIEEKNESGADVHFDVTEDYPDFLDELRNFPERFQKTAESVKDHIRYSGLDKYSTQSKELFNQANQQIQESFTPLLGKNYAPFLAYTVSYGILLLPLVLVTYSLDRIRARYSLQKILLFVNIYLSAYFAALLTVSLVLDTEPMNFFMKYSTSSYIFLQLLQAFGYLMYLLLNTVDLISTCSNGRIAAKFSSVLQWVVVVAVGFHYYVTVFHRAMARKAPLTNWKIYGFYSLSFIFLCLFARIERGKKQYTPAEVDDTTDKKN